MTRAEFLTELAVCNKQKQEYNTVINNMINDLNIGYINDNKLVNLKDIFYYKNVYIEIVLIKLDYANEVHYKYRDVHDKRKTSSFYQHELRILLNNKTLIKQ